MNALRLTSQAASRGAALSSPAADDRAKGHAAEDAFKALLDESAADAALPQGTVVALDAEAATSADVKTTMSAKIPISATAAVMSAATSPDGRSDWMDRWLSQATSSADEGRVATEHRKIAVAADSTEERPDASVGAASRVDDDEPIVPSAPTPRVGGDALSASSSRAVEDAPVEMAAAQSKGVERSRDREMDRPEATPARPEIKQTATDSVSLSPMASPATDVVAAVAASVASGQPFAGQDQQTVATSRVGADNQGEAEIVASLNRAIAPEAVRATRRQSADHAATPETDNSTTRVSVTSLKSWLQPTQAPTPSGGAALSVSTANWITRAETPASYASKPDEGADQAPASSPAPQAEPSPMAALEAVVSERAPARSGQAADAATAPSSGASLPDSASTSRAAGARRDLDVTMEPRDLGGLAVRLKAEGDRLEIAFVAEKEGTARLIGDHGAALENQLRDAGLGRGGLAVSVAEKASAGVGVNSQGSGQGGFGGAQGEAREQREPAPQRQESYGRNRQDLGDDGDKKDNSRQSGGNGGLYL